MNREPEPPGRLASAGRGACAGLIGGLVSGAALARLDRLPEIAHLTGTNAVAVGWAVHLGLAQLLGAGFAVLIRRQRAGTGETVFWGLGYGMFCWYVGVLTLLPLLGRETPAWGVPAARAAFPLLLGEMLGGVITAVGLAALNHTGPVRIRRRALLAGLAAGLGATWGLAASLRASGSILVAGQGLWVALGLGVGAGLGYAWLFPGAGRSLGPATVQGAGYGFLLWVIFPLTVQPLLREGELLWSADQVQARFATLPVYVLYGALIAVLHTAAAWLGRLLLAAPAERADEEGLGARTLRAVGWGASAGVIGGLLFTVIMVQIGYLSTVAGLVGSNVTGVGLAVHLAVSVILGASYGLLFRRQSDDLVSGVGWGLSYGFLWWVLGALTVLPLALGGDPQWSAAGAAAGFPSLVGHLVYGAGVGAVFHRLEARHDPWWIHRVSAAARRAAAIRRRTERQRSAPAVWALVVPMAVTMLVVLG